MKSFLKPLAAAALLGADVAYGGTVQFCPSNANGICYSVGVPTSSASADSGNIYFQISAPSTFQWVALGTGTQMLGSNIFLMFQDGKGNLTLSPRMGEFHVMPPVDTSSTGAKLTLLAGSGVSSDGKTMIANIACSDCQKWSNGGSMSLASTTSSWVSAWRSGSPIDSTNPGVALIQHDDTAIFELDLTKATISSDSNPFVPGSSGSGSGNGNGSGGGGGGSGGGNNSTGSGGNGSGSGSNPDSGSGVTVISDTTPNGALLAAHGVIMALVMVILFPFGAMLMPLMGKWWLHAGWQITTFLLMWAGFGLGVKCAQERNLLFQQAHTVLGTVVVCLFVIQPALGFIHHTQFTKTHSKGAFSHLHIWYGRCMIILGVINGGLGLQLATASNSLIIAYSVVAGAILIFYVVAKVLGHFRSSRNGRTQQNKEASSPRSPPRSAHQDAPVVQE